MVALSLVQLVHWTQVVEHAPEGLDGLDHVDLTEIGKEIAGTTSLWGPEVEINCRLAGERELYLQ